MTVHEYGDGQSINPESKLQLLEADVVSHGEVHATIAELGERDIRRSNSQFDHNTNVVSIDDGQRIHRIDASEIIHWYGPTEF